MFNNKDVVDLINSEKIKSHSKDSLFDHFKWNLFLKCTIPRFDLRKGLPGLKNALDMNDRRISKCYSHWNYSNTIGGVET